MLLVAMKMLSQISDLVVLVAISQGDFRVHQEMMFLVVVWIIL